MIGVDMKTDHILANVVDSYRKADNPGELMAAVSQILAETGDTGTDVGAKMLLNTLPRFHRKLLLT